jgi:Immunity protein 26
MSRQQRKEGMIVTIPAGEGRYAVAQVLADPELAVLDLFVEEKELPSVSAIMAAEPLFRAWVMKSAITNGAWKKVGVAPIRDNFKKGIPRLRRDIMSGELFVVLDGSERRASQTECVGMEPAAVLSEEHVEDRLKLHFRLLDKNKSAFVRGWLASDLPSRGVVKKP